MAERHPVLSVEPTSEDASSELKELLRLTAGDVFPQRYSATRYTICREVVLRGVVRPSLPGFLAQGLTIFRFRDFIHLYDPGIGERVAFIDDAFRASEARAEPKRVFDVFSHSAF